jgi:hypothetical protein
MPFDEHRHPRDGGDQDVAALAEAYDREREEEVRETEREYARLITKLRREHRNQTPWLVLRCDDDDLGIRPLPATTPFWVSPDIWVQSSDPLGNPVAGEENTLVARIFNLGALTAAPVKVDFYWADPSLGLGPSTMHPVGTAYVEIPALGHAEVPCPTPWVPVDVNGGHECVLVNSSNWVLDPITAPFSPTVDRHVGQRNLHVVTAPSGGQVQLSLKIGNVLGVPTRALVGSWSRTLRPLDVEIDPARLGVLATAFVAHEQRELATRPEFPRGSQADRTGRRETALRRRRPVRRPLFEDVTGSRRRPEVTIELGELDERHVHADDARHAGAVLSAMRHFPEDAAVPTLDRPLHLELPPRTRREARARVAVPDDARSGDVIVLHVAQTSGHLVAGGYTLVIQIA